MSLFLWKNTVKPGGTIMKLYETDDMQMENGTQFCSEGYFALHRP
jgi:hypothetical protein